MSADIQCFDGDGEPPPPEKTVRIPCSSINPKKDFTPDDEGCVELLLHFKNQEQCDQRIRDLNDVHHERCWFVLTSAERSIQLIDCYFLGYRQPNAWSMVARFTKPKDVAQLITQRY